MDATNMQECIKQCSDCYKSCLKTIQYCLKKGGEHASPEHINLLQDCAEICKLATSFMIRDSQFAGQVCKLCADICERCREDCEQMAQSDGDKTMQQCADTCRACAEACQQMNA